MALKIMGYPDSTIWTVGILYMTDVHPLTDLKTVQRRSSKNEHPHPLPQHCLHQTGNQLCGSDTNRIIPTADTAGKEILSHGIQPFAE